MPQPARSADSGPPPRASTAALSAFCDLGGSDRARPFHWPELAPGSAPPGAPTTWRWVNVWATWCAPCVEELPRLAAWAAKLVAGGTPVELALVSVDEDEAEVAAFRKAHPATPPTLRIASAEQRTAWLASFGVGDGVIPIHMFVSPTNEVRCVRGGGVRDKDYPVIEQLLAGR